MSAAAVMMPGPEVERYPGFNDPFTSYLDFTAVRHDATTASAWIPLREDLCDATGAVRRGVIGYLIDAPAGLVCGMAAAPSWVVTADLQFRIVADARIGPLRADAIVRRPGRRQSCGEVTIRDEGAHDQLVAFGTVNHLVVPHQGEVDVPTDMPIGTVYGRGIPPSEEQLPHFAELFGFRHTGSGKVEMPIAGLAVNPLGFLHGGLIASLAEEAVLAACGGPLADAVIRFAAPLKSGSARATVTTLSDEGAIVTIDVADDSGRVAAIISARASL
jgi:acyl-coenzyme A thioesterase PaaI-like protein